MDYFKFIIGIISANAYLEQKIANAHMVFNMLGVLLFLPFINVAEKMLNKIPPDKKLLPESELKKYLCNNAQSGCYTFQ